MEQDRDLRRLFDKTMDAISDWPEEHIRKLFSDRRLSGEANFRWEIGGTEYTVVSHFKKNNAEAIVDKVERLLGQDVSS
jgi:hypothetical protein